jgi:hypothetical protein
MNILSLLTNHTHYWGIPMNAKPTNDWFKPATSVAQSARSKLICGPPGFHQILRGSARVKLHEDARI